MGPELNLNHIRTERPAKQVVSCQTFLHHVVSHQLSSTLSKSTHSLLVVSPEANTSITQVSKVVGNHTHGLMGVSHTHTHTHCTTASQQLGMLVCECASWLAVSWLAVLARRSLSVLTLGGMRVAG